MYYTYVARQTTTPQTNVKISWNLLYLVERGIDIPELLKEKPVTTGYGVRGKCSLFLRREKISTVEFLSALFAGGDLGLPAY